MSKIIFSSLWLLATCMFLLGGTTVFTNQYMPESWDFLKVNKVLGEQITQTEVEQVEVEASAAAALALAQTTDARAHLVANFIERNDSGKNSPLQPYDDWGRIFVEIADEYGLDFRLLPAIARKESTFCKSNIAKTYYNCFGYGVPASGITEAGKFNSYQEGIRVVAASLKRSYLDKGLTDPEAIMAKYCPPSANGDGTWAAHLNQWLAEMRYDDKAAGQTQNENADLTELVP